MLETVPFWMWPVGFLLVLGPLVTVHELGHYLVGRWFGVKAEAFSVGFGKEIAGFNDKHGTRWKLSMLPLGGYVQFKGDMNPASIPDAAALKNLSEEERDGSFQQASLWKRALIVFAGPATNIIVTVAIFASFNLIYGKLEASNAIGAFAEVSAAREAGLKIDDKIVAIDGEAIAGFEDIAGRALMFPGKTLQIDVERGAERLSVPVTLADVVETDQFGNESRVGRLGIAAKPPERLSVGPVEAVTLAGTQSWNLVTMMVTGIKQILTGDRSVRELGGPIKIAKFSGEQLSLGWPTFIAFAAMISLNLAFINLLPIPALDGGHLAFYAAEAIRRKPIGPQGTEWAYRIGVGMVLVLMVFVTVNDVISLPVFGG